MAYSSPDPNRRAAAGVRFRAGLNVAMGILYIILGGAVVVLRRFGMIELDAIISYALGGLFVLYGVFRIWRGLADFKELRAGRIE